MPKLKPTYMYVVGPQYVGDAIDICFVLAPFYYSISGNLILSSLAAVVWY